MAHPGGWAGKSSDTSICRQGSSRLDLDADRDVEPRWPLSRVVRLVAADELGEGTQSCFVECQK